MCYQPLLSPLSPPFAKLLIMALEEYGYQSRSGIRGKPLTKIDSSGDHDSADQIASVDNDITNFLASKIVVYGTNSLLEQWKESYANGTIPVTSESISQIFVLLLSRLELEGLKWNLAAYIRKVLPLGFITSITIPLCLSDS
ncbi:hypothetical protein Tco_0261481 [Tanacetum coccineum]